jgi:hypothetical protein
MAYLRQIQKMGRAYDRGASTRACRLSTLGDAEARNFRRSTEALEGIFEAKTWFQEDVAPSASFTALPRNSGQLLNPSHNNVRIFFRYLNY